MFKGFLCGLLFSATCLSAQVVAGAGYVAPTPVSVAPGQILTFFADGIGTAGITATLRQGSDHKAPVIDVRALSTCPGPGSDPAVCGTLTAVTVQIPYELIPLCPLCLTPVFLVNQLVITGGGHSVAIGLNALADQVHVLSSCDIAITAAGFVAPANTSGLPCPPMVTHADGSLVTAEKPANIGEALTAWVTGLGATNPAAATGQPSAKPLPTARTFSLDFNYTSNALPVKPRARLVILPPLAPVYSGLAAGFAGLYQVNFVVPEQPAGGTPRCAATGTAVAGTNAVQSNLTVSIGGGFSFDGAGICVATQIPVD